MWAALGWFVFKVAISFAISYALRPDPQTPDSPDPAGLDEFDIPTAQVGREFPVLFGTKAMKSQNVVWYGDFHVEEVEESTDGGMFSSGKEYTVAYKYYIGMHLVLAHDVQDILAVVVDGNKVWEGSAKDNNNIATIVKPDLWGGYKRGGGIAGTSCPWPEQGIKEQTHILQIKWMRISRLTEVCLQLF